MEVTLTPVWWERREWIRRWVNKPVRLWIVCHVEGHRPWRISKDVMPDQDVLDSVY